MTVSATTPPPYAGEAISSSIVAGFERVSIVVGAVGFPRCPSARSAIPSDIKISDDVIELLCACGAMALLAVELLEPVEDGEEGEA